MNSFARTMNITYEYYGEKFDRGIHYDWCTRRSTRDSILEGENWLSYAIKNIKTLLIKRK